MEGRNDATLQAKRRDYKILEVVSKMEGSDDEHPFDPFVLSPDERWRQKRGERQLQFVMQKFGPVYGPLLIAVFLAICFVVWIRFIAR